MKKNFVERQLNAILNMKEIDENEIEKYQEKGAGYFCEWGYVSPRNNYPYIIYNPDNTDRYFLRPKTDLITSEDGVFVKWIDQTTEEEKLPNFEEVFKVEKY